MLGLAKRIKARIFQASTSEIYGDPQLHRKPDINLASEQLNWVPKISLKYELNETITYLRQLITSR
jgi:nucleoside-diphosphate-sugar epimerase